MLGDVPVAVDAIPAIKYTEGIPVTEANFSGLFRRNVSEKKQEEIDKYSLLNCIFGSIN